MRLRPVPHSTADATWFRVSVCHLGLGESPGAGLAALSYIATDFCVEAVQEAISWYGTPATFNTDQGCQFTSQEFTGFLQTHGIQISMDGTGRWRDNVFVERLWRSLKYEEVYLHAYETVGAAREGVARYRNCYNQRRPHRALDGRTPDRVYCDNQPARPTAA